jgi:hypothetical protein
VYESVTASLPPDVLEVVAVHGPIREVPSGRITVKR